MEEKKERLEEKGASGEESGATAAGEGAQIWEKSFSKVCLCPS